MSLISAFPHFNKVEMTFCRESACSHTGAE